MKMWSGRFREPLHPGFEQWQRSLSFDWRLLPQEIAASKAHARMIAAAGILNNHELEAIVSALEAIATEYAARPPADIWNRAEAEDVHHFVELELTARIGDTGLKLHTGRSRNEQIATDLRLYVREQCALLAGQLAAWSRALAERAASAGEDTMPSYTHLQRAEPVLVAHWLLAYTEMLLRDIARLKDLAVRLNDCPLGSGAVAGATLRLDRALAAAELGFRSPTANSMDATSDRDFVLEFLHALTLVALHASRFAEEITLFATAEFGFVDLPEAFSTGSSAMPQKKNPDFAELARAKAARIDGAAQSAALLLKGLPLAYNKDLQEMQIPLFTAAEETLHLAELLAAFTAVLGFNRERMRAACETGYLNAMAAATYLVHKGLPFRKAHEKVGQAVRYGIERRRELNELTLEELQQFGPEFGADFFSHITPAATVNCHDVIGGTAVARVRQALAEHEGRLSAAIGQSLGQRLGQNTGQNNGNS